MSIVILNLGIMCSAMSVKYLWPLRIKTFIANIMISRNVVNLDVSMFPSNQKYV